MMSLRSFGDNSKSRRSAIAARSIQSRQDYFFLTLGRGTKIQDLLMSEDKEYVRHDEAWRQHRSRRIAPEQVWKSDRFRR